MTLDAAWLWVPDFPVGRDQSLDPDAIVRFARSRGLREVFVSVPWLGPHELTFAICTQLSKAGVRVSALGSACDWAVRPERAGSWAERAHAQGLFTRSHLDIEPWTATDWPAHAPVRLRGITEAIHHVRNATGMPVDVDLAPGLAESHPREFAEIARAADQATVMSYRNTAAAILEFSATARAALRQVRTAYRLAVETLPSEHSHATFVGRPESVMVGEVSAAERGVGADAESRGFAVHDLLGWMGLPERVVG